MSELSITTSQNVQIKFLAATVGDRILAAIIDLLIKIAYCISIIFLVFYVLNLDRIIENLDYWSKMAIFIILFFPVVIYSIFFESVFEGQTLGKKLFQIKVIKIDGYQANFGDYFMRWIFRLIDLQIASAFIGIVVIITNNKNQRLGDIVAGTAVINLKNNISISHTILEEISDNYTPTFPSVIKLNDNDIRIIKETFQSARENGNTEVIEKLILKIEEVTGIKNKISVKAHFIETILKDYNFYTGK